MNYWDRLENLEKQIIRLDSIESLVRIAANSDSPSDKDIQNLLWYLDGSITDINKKISENFYSLWEEVREDSWQETYDRYDQEQYDYDSAKRFEKIIEPFIPKEQ